MMMQQSQPSEHSPIPATGTCPACGSADVEMVYSVPAIPVHSVLLVRSRQEALDFRRGDMDLAACAACGFIFNAAFDGTKLNYSREYEETQGFSSTFSAFHRRLAAEVIDRYNLHHKHVLEIGCGKGEFLTLLCEMGPNRGTGFDPAYAPERHETTANDRIAIVQDFYSEAFAHVKADFIGCKMTLEHIPDVYRFVRTVRRSIGDRETTVFFQIPNTTRVLEEYAFWDVYYEHCSYFTASSLATLFTRAGFEVRDVWTDYDDQYLMLDALPAAVPVSGDGYAGIDVPTPAAANPELGSFREGIDGRLAAWREGLAATRARGERVVLWGGGSKAVAFLTTLSVTNEVVGAVDINPFKHGTYLAGRGHDILAPADLRKIQPDVVIIMNPIYRREIASDLSSLGIDPRLVDVTDGHDTLTSRGSTG